MLFCCTSCTRSRCISADWPSVGPIMPTCTALLRSDGVRQLQTTPLSLHRGQTASGILRPPCPLPSSPNARSLAASFGGNVHRTALDHAADTCSPRGKVLRSALLCNRCPAAVGRGVCWNGGCTSRIHGFLILCAFGRDVQTPFRKRRCGARGGALCREHADDGFEGVAVLSGFPLGCVP